MRPLLPSDAGSPVSSRIPLALLALLGIAAVARADEPVPAPAGEPPAAAAPAKPALSPAEKEFQGLLKLGASLTDRGDYPAAEIAFRQILNGNAPEEPTKSALLGLARMHRKQGGLTKAAAIYERFLKDYPNDDRVPDALLDLGRTLRSMGATQLAIARFYNVINSTLKLPSGDGFSHYQLLAKTAQFEVAETHFQSGNYAESGKFFARLRMLDLAPADRARAHFKSAYALYLGGDFESAVTTLRSYLEQWPDDENGPEARYLLSISLRTLKRPQEALNATLDLLRAEKTRTATSPKLWTYWQRRTGNQLANDFFQSGDVRNALAIYQGLAELGDDAAWKLPVTYQTALCQERLGDPDRAVATYRQIVDTIGPKPANPDLGDIARMAGSRLAHLGWKGDITRQFTTLFDTTTGRPPPAAPKPDASHEPHGNPPAAPSAL
jgi:TolA-binding protein